MKIFKRVLIALLAIILLAGVVGFFLPQHVLVERSAVINAPVEVVSAQINEFKNWNNWSPWYAIDPTEKIVYSEPSSGKGAWFTWESLNSEVGSGKMMLGEVTADKTEFILNYQNSGDANGFFTFTPENGGTKVNWSFDADFKNNPYMHLVGLFMDKMLGGYFEKGLANMKAYVESHPVAPATPATPEIGTAVTDSSAATH